MLKRGITIASFVLISTVLLIVGWHQHNKRMDRHKQLNKGVDKIGQTLASWSNAHQTRILINGKQINFIGPINFVMERGGVCRGFTGVSWQTKEATSEDNETLRENLSRIVRSSDCDLEMLVSYTDKLNSGSGLRQLEAEDLAHDLKCLVKFEFASLEIK